MLKRNTIEVSEVMIYLKSLPDESVDCCLCSPPFYGLRNYNTGHWEGGDPNCEHSGLLPSQLGSGKNSLLPNSQARTTRARQASQRGVCRKCGAILHDDQIGMEDTPFAYIDRLVVVFREVRRVLKPWGTLGIEIGDSYWGGKGQSGHGGRDFQQKRSEKGLSFSSPEAHIGGPGKTRPTDRKSDVFKPKDLMLIPHRLAIALQSDGWWLRQDNVWNHVNCMPESVQDRSTRAHSYVFMFAKSKKYFYDAEAIKEPSKESSLARIRQATFASQTGGAKDYGHGTNGSRSMRKTLENFAKQDGHGRRQYTGFNERYDAAPVPMANARSVWSISPEPTRFAHFATWPTRLVKRIILAGCPEKVCAKCGKPWRRVIEKTNTPHKAKTDSLYPEGSAARRLALVRQAARQNSNEYANLTRTIGWEPSCQCDSTTAKGLVLDPFMGSGTTALVARALGRDYLGCDLNENYVKLARERLRKPFEEHHVQQETKLDDLPLIAGLGGEK